MPTGACGINCDVCKLRLMGTCSTCGSGKSEEARRKLDAQQRIFGGSCPVLECAVMNGLDYCTRDCNLFPCDNFRSGPYPFSESFLNMQQRRRRETPPARTHNDTPLQVPPEYWEQLQQKDVNALCNLTLAQPVSDGGIVFPSLGREIVVDIPNRRLLETRGGEQVPMDDPLMELVTLLYLNHVKGLHPIGKDIVAPQDLKEAHYFKGRHALRLDPLVDRYGHDLHGFRQAAEHLRGEPMDMADAAYRLLPFPRVPVYYLLWEGDEEFEPRISVLFDRSIEEAFLASGIWALVNLTSTALLRGPDSTLQTLEPGGRS